MRAAPAAPRPERPSPTSDIRCHPGENRLQHVQSGRPGRSGVPLSPRLHRKRQGSAQQACHQYRAHHRGPPHQVRRLHPPEQNTRPRCRGCHLHDRQQFKVHSRGIVAQRERYGTRKPRRRRTSAHLRGPWIRTGLPASSAPTLPSPAIPQSIRIPAV